jgi:hypothetical protein
VNPLSRSAARPPRLGLETLEARALLSASHLAVSVPLAATAGDVVAVTVTAVDDSSTLAADYTGTVQLSSSDAHAVLPASYTFTAADHGQHVFVVQLQTAGMPTVLAKDAANGSISGLASLTLVPAAADHFAVQIAGDATAGTPTTATVVAQDAFGNTVTTYAGTAHFTTTDPHASAPADHTFLPSDNGSYSANVTFLTAGTQTLSVSDDAGHQGSADVTVAPGEAASFDVSGPGRPVIGRPTAYTVTALDLYGNVATGYTGTVQLTIQGTTGPIPVDPIQHTYTPSDAGVAVLSVTAQAFEPFAIAVNDSVSSSVTGRLVVSGVYATGNENYVATLYQTLLGRPADSIGMEGWSRSLDRGMRRGQVVLGIENSVEYRTQGITALYQNLLGRAPDATGLNDFLQAMDRGLTLEGVAVAILASDEYYQVRGGGTDLGFLDALYADSLARAADDGGQRYFGGLLAHGTAHADVVKQILMSTEAEDLTVDVAYQQFLGRDPDAAGRHFFVEQLKGGMPSASLFAALLGSDEFFRNVTS